MFKTVNIRQQKTVTSERWRKTEVSPAIAPDYCLQKVSRLQHQEWRMTQADESNKQARVLGPRQPFPEGPCCAER